jgi:hypothetical protein
MKKGIFLFLSFLIISSGYLFSNEDVEIFKNDTGEEPTYVIFNGNNICYFSRNYYMLLDGLTGNIIDGDTVINYRIIKNNERLRFIMVDPNSNENIEMIYNKINRNNRANIYGIWRSPNEQFGSRINPDLISLNRINVWYEFNINGTGRIIEVNTRTNAQNVMSFNYILNETYLNGLLMDGIIEWIISGRRYRNYFIIIENVLYINPFQDQTMRFYDYIKQN